MQTEEKEQKNIEREKEDHLEEVSWVFTDEDPNKVCKNLEVIYHHQ